MGISDKRSHLSIDIPIKESIWLQKWADSHNSNVKDFVLSCIREHMPCRLEHGVNDKTAADLSESEEEKKAISFSSPKKMFQYLGLPITCLDKNSQKTSSVTLKKRGVRKKI
jgi:hypothetical protein